jgi:putative Mg2+ transporter-C (MgtC) family protein
MMTYALMLRLAAALVVGVIIGIERQWRHKLAGLRTNVLVSVGAAMPRSPRASVSSALV